MRPLKTSHWVFKHSIWHFTIFPRVINLRWHLQRHWKLTGGCAPWILTRNPLIGLRIHQGEETPGYKILFVIKIFERLIFIYLIVAKFNWSKWERVTRLVGWCLKKKNHWFHQKLSRFTLIVLPAAHRNTNIILPSLLNKWAYQPHPASFEPEESESDIEHKQETHTMTFHILLQVPFETSPQDHPLTVAKQKWIHTFFQNMRLSLFPEKKILLVKATESPHSFCPRSICPTLALAVLQHEGLEQRGQRFQFKPGLTGSNSETSFSRTYCIFDTAHLKPLCTSTVQDIISLFWQVI